MTRVVLEAAQDHVEFLAHEADPVRAVLELVWNGLDADAHHVTVELARADGGGVVGVLVADDGHGMAPEAVESAFRWIGGSWKRLERRSRGERRPLHGKSGQGRLRAFALGTNMRWETIADDTAGRRFKVVVTASATSRNDFEISDPLEVRDPPGTAFEASGKQGLDRLETDKTRAQIISALAPYLIANDTIEVVYDGTRIQPADNIENDTVVELEFEHGSQRHQAALRIIEWRVASGRSIHLCDETGVPVDDLDSAPAPDFQYSAYVMWSGMPEHRGEWLLSNFEEQEPSVVGALVSAARARIEEHFEARRSQRRRELVADWKVTRTYPYEAEPQSAEERLERATFDVVATSIERHIPKPKKQQKLVLGLLRDTLQQRPANVTELLDQYLGLGEIERAQLDDLLKRTSLSRIIQATASVTNRLEFLRALELMVFDPEANDMVGERMHLHRILERELWVFGEQFNLMASERGLSAVLDRHLQLLGEARTDTSPVRRVDGSAGRLDIVLSAAASEYDRNRHLVIELKAPKVKATATEVRQIKSYANAVVADPRFASTRAVWDFWLVVAEMDHEVRLETTQRGREKGLIHEPQDPAAPETSVRVWVKTWAEVLEEAQQRLEYFRSNLRHDPSMEDARDYLATNHGDVIPEALMQGSGLDDVPE